MSKSEIQVEQYQDRVKDEVDDEGGGLLFKEDGQEYGKVLRMLDDHRCEAMCSDGEKRVCDILPRKRKDWIAVGDVILASRCEFCPKFHVIWKYKRGAVELLKISGEFPEISLSSPGEDQERIDEK